MSDIEYLFIYLFVKRTYIKYKIKHLRNLIKFKGALSIIFFITKKVKAKEIISTYKNIFQLLNF